MKNVTRLFLIAIILLPCLLLAANETPTWEKTVTEDGTASTYTSKWDADGDGDEAGETVPYKYWTVCNLVETTDTVCVNLTSNSSGVQNAAVCDGSRSTSRPVRPATCRSFSLLEARSTISMICSGAACTSVDIHASVLP